MVTAQALGMRAWGCIIASLLTATQLAPAVLCHCTGSGHELGHLEPGGPVARCTNLRRELALVAGLLGTQYWQHYDPCAALTGCTTLLPGQLGALCALCALQARGKGRTLLLSPGRGPRQPEALYVLCQRSL